MKQDRFLTGILIGIGVLVVVALAVFFTRRNTQTYVSEDKPEGVVYNYVLAVLNNNYEKAYGYLADLDNKPPYDEFHQQFLNGSINPDNAAIDVGKSLINGDTASVAVAQIYNPGDPFSSGYRDLQYAILVKQKGAWKISSMPAYNFWNYSWYQEVPK